MVLSILRMIERENRGLEERYELPINERCRNGKKRGLMKRDPFEEVFSHPLLPVFVPLLGPVKGSFSLQAQRKSLFKREDQTEQKPDQLNEVA